MTPREYLDLFRRRWRAVVVGLSVGLVLAGLVIVFSPKEYQAQATIFVSARPGTGDVTAALEANELSAQRMATYVELLKSQKIANEVAAQLGPEAPSGLAERLDASTVPDTQLLAVTARGESPDQAMRLANLAAERFIANVGALEQPEDPLAPPLVHARVFQPAIPSEELASPRPLLYLWLGAFFGLLGGIGFALLRQMVDTTINSAQQLRAVLGAPVLGTVGRLRGMRRQLALRAKPWGAEAEAIRRLRTNLQFIPVGGAHKTILFTSPAPSSERTAVVCNLALALADAGNRVLVIDANLRDPGVSELFEVSGGVGLADVLTGATSLAHVMLRVHDGLDLVPSGHMPPNPSELLGSARMVRVIHEARGAYDMVLIDASPVASVADAAAVAPRVDGVVLVVEHGETTVQQVRDACEELRLVYARLVGGVLALDPGKPNRRELGRRRPSSLTPAAGEEMKALRPAGPPGSTEAESSTAQRSSVSAEGTSA